MEKSTGSIHRLGNPAVFARFSRRLMPWLGVLTVGVLGYGLYLALLASPQDYLQGQTVRIMYVHVPSAWLSMGIYALMACASAAWLIWRYPLADLVARNAAPLGAGFTLITLATGSLWGKPMWGAWWVWDARLTSVLILFFLYVGYISVANSTMVDDTNRKIAAYLSLFGAINLPIIKFSVEWFNTLHQPASVVRLDGPTIAADMLTPLLLMFAGFSGLFCMALLWRMQASLYRQKIRRLQLQAQKH